MIPRKFWEADSKLKVIQIPRFESSLCSVVIASASSSATLSSANIASASSARQLKSLDFPHAIPVNNIASTGTCLAAGPTVKEDTPSG